MWICIVSHSVLQAQRPDSPNRITINALYAPFYHGVASGDPLPNAVIIWTKVTDTIPGPVTVQWYMATDTNFVNIVSQGTVVTDASRDYTVKVDVTGLQPKTCYYYVFKALGKYSLIGRTKTSPAYEDNSTDSLRFAVLSCANYESGFFTAYDHISKRNDIDAVIHLGDYIYEYEEGGYAPNSNTPTRKFLPTNEIITLNDYRMRYSLYHKDNQLIKLHQHYPFICVWDDHESANDAWRNGAENHQSGEGPWGQRKFNAAKAYFEYMPVRQPDMSDTLRIFRTIRYGKLLKLIMLDTRLYDRDEQNGTSGSIVTATTRKLLGNYQLNWFKSQLDTTSAQWKIVGQQVMMAPLKIFGSGLNGDQWDGYPAERQRVYDHIINNNIQNVFVLTGDIHSSWANDLPLTGYSSSTGANSAGVEFVTPSVTSPGLDFLSGLAGGFIQLNNSHIKYVDLDDHGYILLDINKTRAQAEWVFLSTIDNLTYTASTATRWKVNQNTRYLVSSSANAVPRPNINCAFPPKEPKHNMVVSLSNTTVTQKPLILSLYPNPAREEAIIEYYLPKSTPVHINITDLQGKILITKEIPAHTEGLYFIPLSVQELSAGMYVIQVQTQYGTAVRKLIKN